MTACCRTCTIESEKRRAALAKITSDAKVLNDKIALEIAVRRAERS